MPIIKSNKLLFNTDYVVRYEAGCQARLIEPDNMVSSSMPITKSDRVSILVWNIFKQKRLDCMRLLEEYVDNTTLLILQEAQTTPQLLNFIHSHHKIADQVPAYAFKDVYSGVMTIANIAPIKSIGFKEKEPLIRIPKSALVTQYQILDHKRTLLVANIHAVNFSFGLKIYRQQIRILLNQLVSHEGPIILAGDFNSWSRQRLHLLYRLIRKINLKMVNFSSDIRKTFMGRPLDFVFYRDLKIEQAKIVHTNASDHNPILVDFIIS